MASKAPLALMAWQSTVSKAQQRQSTSEEPLVLLAECCLAALSMEFEALPPSVVQSAFQLQLPLHCCQLPSMRGQEATSRVFQVPVWLGRPEILALASQALVLLARPDLAQSWDLKERARDVPNAKLSLAPEASQSATAGCPLPTVQKALPSAPRKLAMVSQVHPMALKALRAASSGSDVLHDPD